MRVPCIHGGRCPISCVSRRVRTPKDETGKRYGSLTVVKREGKCWLTKCDCNGWRVADGRQLRFGLLKACKTCAKQTQGRGGRRRGLWDKEAA